MRIEGGILYTDHNNQRYPISEFMVGEVEYHDKKEKYTGWTFQIIPISDVIKKFYPELESIIRDFGYIYLMPSQDENHVREIRAEILAYSKTASDGEYWRVEIGEGEYSYNSIAFFYGGRWYEIEVGEYVPECKVIDNKVKLICCVG